MLNFKELSQDGDGFELLIREILFATGHRPYWSGKGSDGGKDLLCEEPVPSIIFVEKRLWLVQCKHFAHADRAVGVSDLDDIVDSCMHHGAAGYLLACSTFPSSKVVERLEGITANKSIPVVAAYWDAVRIERLLRTPRGWPIAQQFFPVSAAGWSIFATEHPNRWIANYKGYYFHLSNRIGSNSDVHLDSIASRLAEVEAISLPDEHFIRLRGVYYDDKNARYTWFLDYMRPKGEAPAVDVDSIKGTLKDEVAWEDGQIYAFDVMFREYKSYSDHYDRDHHDYYAPYLANFYWGLPRDWHVSIGGR